MFTVEEMWSRPIRTGAAIQVGHVGVGTRPFQLPDCGDLGDRHVVEHAERSDDHTGEQEALRVEVGSERSEETDRLVGESGQIRESDEDPCQQCGHGQARNRRQQRCRRGEVDAVCEEQSEECNCACCDEGDQNGVRPREDGRENERDDHDQAGDEPGERANAFPSSEQHDGHDEQRT